MQSQKMIWRQAALIRSVELQLPQDLIISGCRFRPKRQLPVVSGMAATVRDIVGSIRDLAIRRGVLCGNLRWCSDPAAKQVQAKYDAGILVFRLNIAEWEVRNLRSGESLSGIRGPARIVDIWQPMSVTLIARADQ
jgi:hypothetical protein